MALYWAANGLQATTAAQLTQLTGTAMRTMQQVATPSTRTLKVVAFGVEFASALTAAATVELIDTGTVACTGMTAHVAAGVQPYGSDAQGGASDMTLGTGATGYFASGNTLTEGTVTSGRTAKSKILPIGATSYEWEWSQGREFAVPVSHFLRTRITTSVTIGAFTWILWDE